MNTAFAEFQSSMNDVRKIRVIYDYLVNTHRLDESDIVDLLRAQLVNSVSALDRYLHEVIRIGIVQSFLQNRPLTSKFNTFTLTSKTILKIMTLNKDESTAVSVEDKPSFWIDKEVFLFLKTYAFQHPDKIREGLSYIWDEDHKWQVVARAMNISGTNDNDKQKNLVQRLTLISERRNQIVHEADFDPFLRVRRPISIQEVDDILNFIELFVKTIHYNITIP